MLQLNNIHLQVRDRKLLSGITMQAAPGDVVAILGANGAGKSTLIRVICSEWTTYQGEVLWNGVNQKAVKASESAQYRAVLTQNIHVTGDLSVEDIVLMGRYPHFGGQPGDFDYSAVDELIESCGVSSFRDKRYQQLSGGEKQRVQLARVLCQLKDREKSGPKLLLLDEPLNNLDIRHQHLCMQRARDFAAQGNIVVMVIHDVNIALRYASHLLLLKKGRMLAAGTPQEVLTEDVLEACYDLPVKLFTLPGTAIPHVFFEQEYTGEEQVFNETFISSISTL